MFGFIKKLFGSAPVAEAPYKVELTRVDTADIAIAQLPTPVADDPVEAPKVEVKKTPVSKPRKPRASKAIGKPTAKKTKK